MTAIGAVDIGGTKLAVGIVDEGGRQWLLSRMESSVARSRGHMATGLPDRIGSDATPRDAARYWFGRHWHWYRVNWTRRSDIGTHG